MAVPPSPTSTSDAFVRPLRPVAPVDMFRHLFANDHGFQFGRWKLSLPGSPQLSARSDLQSLSEIILRVIRAAEDYTSSQVTQELSGGLLEQDTGLLTNLGDEFARLRGFA